MLWCVDEDIKVCVKPVTRRGPQDRSEPPRVFFSARLLSRSSLIRWLLRTFFHGKTTAAGRGFDVSRPALDFHIRRGTPVARRPCRADPPRVFFSGSAADPAGCTRTVAPSPLPSILPHGPSAQRRRAMRCRRDARPRTASTPRIRLAAIASDDSRLVPPPRTRRGPLQWLRMRGARGEDRGVGAGMTHATSPTTGQWRRHSAGRGRNPIGEASAVTSPRRG